MIIFDFEIEIETSYRTYQQKDGYYQADDSYDREKPYFLLNYLKC